MRWLKDLVVKPRQRVTAELTVFDRDTHRVSVVGESHYQVALRAVTGRRKGTEFGDHFIAELVPDPANEYDSNAVQVQIEGRCVGHLSRADAEKYVARITAMREGGQPAICSCFAGCRGTASGNPNIGVSLGFPSDWA